MTPRKKAAVSAAPAEAQGATETAVSEQTPSQAPEQNSQPAAKQAKPAKAAKKAAKSAVKSAAKSTVKSVAKNAAVPAKAAKSAGKAKEAKPKGVPAKKDEPAEDKAKAEKPKSGVPSERDETATVLDSKVVYEGKLFRVHHDHVLEPGGRDAYRDVIRHNGSVVILAVDSGNQKASKRKKDPWVVVERQYRHAAGQFLWELPAGKLDGGEAPIEGAKRELAEETGYQAKKWSALVEYFASPGFLGESMKVFLAEGLVAGDAHPEADEHIDFRLVRLSELLELVDKGKIIDGKTLTTILLYARRLGLKRKK